MANRGADRRLSWSLSEFLSLLDLRGRAWSLLELGSSEGFSQSEHDGIWFYIALKGSASIVGPSDTAADLTPGRVHIILSGEAHTVHTSPRGAIRKLDFPQPSQPVDRVPVFAFGRKAPVTRILCGRLQVTWPNGARPAALPAALTLGGNTPSADLDMRRAETLQGYTIGAGAPTMLTSIAAMFLAMGVRAHPQCPLLFREPAADDPIAYVQQLITTNLEGQWTIAKLARCAGMSRTSFAERFRAKIGRAPMEFLTEQRMQFAQSLIYDTDLLVSEISVRAGYQSEVSFTRRFKSTFGLAPSQLRRSSRSANGKIDRGTGDWSHLRQPEAWAASAPLKPSLAAGTD